MSTNEKILSALREAYTGNKAVTINLNEASALTGSGLNIGGRTIFDDAFAALRLANPFRSRPLPAMTQGRMSRCVH